jgi:hypothetical protein
MTDETYQTEDQGAPDEVLEQASDADQGDAEQAGTPVDPTY